MSSNPTRDSIRQRAQSAIFLNAVSKPQSLTIIALAVMCWILGISFLGVTSAIWLAFGAVAELIFVLATVSDPQQNAEAVERIFAQQYDINEVRNHHARQRVAQALEYQENIRALAQTRGGAMRLQIESTADEVNHWLEQVFKLARRIDDYESSDIISRDRVRVPNELQSLRLRLDKEQDERVKAELRDAIRSKELQLSHLRDLEANVKRADVQLDNTLAALGTIYTQIQLLDAKSIDGRSTNRLRQEIVDEVLSLKDTLEALEEVQATGMYAVS
ncbi:MAG: hypothetical protein K8L91_17070 [Anaerolineae bacterium]|nr:hypothetical protein [Anaerolineae bacterium]